MNENIDKLLNILEEMDLKSTADSLKKEIQCNFQIK